MRGTAGHPEIAPLVRNQKESVRGERMTAQRMGTQGARERRRVGMVGWSGQDVCEGDRVCVCVSE